ncbi:MAG: capsule assembly Wzi family protein [Thermodesulfovibrionales bacterium]
MSLSKHLRLLAALCLLSFVPAPAPAAIGLDVGDAAYRDLERLEAEGLIESSLLNLRPISRREAARLVLEAERNAARSGQGAGDLARALIARLKAEFAGDLDDTDYLKPAGRAALSYIYSDSAGPELNYNNDGDPYAEGSNARAAFTSMAEVGPLSLFANPELRAGGGDTDLVARSAYAALEMGGLELFFGRQSQWWGPGRHGSLLLSNNAAPFTMVRVTNPTPALLPWVLSRLGPVRFVFFAGRLEEERSVPEPYLWGLRLDFKPVPWVEVGLERTALLGGEGRSEGLGTWWKSFTGKGENEAGVEAGDQRAGLDLKITVPLSVQPFQLYGEAAGEDESGGLPSKWAYLAGLYLPRILSLERVGLRAEVADNHIDGSPNAWYNHHIYRTGYTYKGRVVGHHMGTDSRDVFLEMTYEVPALDGRLRLAYDREKHNLSGTPASSRAGKREYRASLDVSLSEDLWLDGTCAFADLEGSGAEDEASLLYLRVGYRF